MNQVKPRKVKSESVNVGLISLARTTFDLALAKNVTDQARALLEQAGYSLLGPETLVTNLHEAGSVAQQLGANPLDLLLVLQATFADSTMVMELARAIDAPLLLWAVPEARTGGRLRLNSFCGVNLAAHALARGGYFYDYVYAAPDAPGVLDKVHTLALAGRARRLLRSARIGRVGQHPAGLDTCRVDGDALARHFGVEVVEVDLGDVFQAAQAADPAEVEAIFDALAARLDGLQQLDQVALRKTLGSYVALRDLAQQERLDALAVRCWPEFFTELGCAACGAMSMLSDASVPCSCEADVNGTITQLVLQWLSSEAAFGTDMVSFDLEEDVAVVWHCGLAPLSMADPSIRPRATIHSNRQLPLLMEFPLKPGPVTVARLSETAGRLAGDGSSHYRLVVGKGQMVQAPMSFSGTSGVLRFDHPAADVLDTILNQGLEHHVSLTYGDHVAALLALARMLALPVLRL